MPSSPPARFSWNWLLGCGNLLACLTLMALVHWDTLQSWWTSGSSPVMAAKEPVFSHGMNLPVRQAVEPEFTPETKRWGIEVYRDPRTGQLVYVTERGEIQVLPAP